MTKLSAVEFAALLQKDVMERKCNEEMYTTIKEFMGSKWTSDLDFVNAIPVLMVMATDMLSIVLESMEEKEDRVVH